MAVHIVILVLRKVPAMKYTQSVLNWGSGACSPGNWDSRLSEIVPNAILVELDDLLVTVSEHAHYFG